MYTKESLEKYRCLPYFTKFYPFSSTEEVVPIFFLNNIVKMQQYKKI